VLFLKFWVKIVLHPELLQLLVMDIYNNLAKKDQNIFGKAVKNALAKHWKKL